MVTDWSQKIKLGLRFQQRIVPAQLIVLCELLHKDI